MPYPIGTVVKITGWYIGDSAEIFGHSWGKDACYYGVKRLSDGKQFVIEDKNIGVVVKLAYENRLMNWIEQ